MNNMSAHKRHKPGRNRQSQPSALDGIIRIGAQTLKILEQIASPRRHHASASIDDFDQQPVGRAGRAHHAQPQIDAAMVRELDRIGQQIEQNLAQPRRVRRYTLRHVARGFQAQRQALRAGAGAKHVHTLLRDAPRVDRGNLQFDAFGFYFG